LASIERVRTGIDTLDMILNGGVPKNSVILLAGGPGTGKTIAAAQFIYNGATRFSEKGVFVTFNESSEVFKHLMLALGWDFETLENQGMIKIFDLLAMKKGSLETILDMILEETRVFGAKRIVIDSVTAITAAFGEKMEIRSSLSVIQKLLRKLDCTSILISETPWGEDNLGSGVEEFTADGIIRFETIPVKGELKRRMVALKMRGTNHDMKFYQYTIGAQDGIIITPYPEMA